MKPVLKPGLTINEPSDNGKHIFRFNTFKLSSSILRFKTSHGSFVNKKHGTEFIVLMIRSFLSNKLEEISMHLRVST
jgi:hypothetical protein